MTTSPASARWRSGRNWTRTATSRNAAARWWARESATLDASAALPEETAGALHALGYVYLRQGQSRRASVLLLLAARQRPMDAPLMRTLAASLSACGLGERALEVLDHAARLEPEADASRPGRVLRARALLAAGRREEARAAFRDGLEEDAA
ncbi:hypothetical protein ACE7GA_22275 [Roseomonas sp. CCTCC AB2023176]|uniref:hypothetical protein n=1 Tax=Roseomonas sp. CCTCC AB2023176 TaxID=3342640 RepID=UPI0035DD6358